MRKILLISILFFSLNLQAFVVLIDPGHGGKELGAVSRVVIEGRPGKKKTKKIFEKDLTLIIAKKVQSRLKKKFTTYLTRSFDRQVKLEDRAQMADDVKADLFVSIHLNSTRSSKSNGFEIYYLDNHDDLAVQKVEKIENKDIDGEDKVVHQILIDLVIGKTEKFSKSLAKEIHKEIKEKVQKRYRLKDRGIKPGLFYVLALSKRPGVLIEVGFMSNPKEIWKLRSNNFQDKYADAIANGIINYYSKQPKKKLPLF